MTRTLFSFRMLKRAHSDRLKSVHMPLSAGDILGPYEILSPISKGGMGEVYKARDPRLGWMRRASSKPRRPRA